MGFFSAMGLTRSLPGTKGNTCSPCSLFLFNLLPQDCPPPYILIFGERDSRQKIIPARRGKCSKSFKVTERRGIVGDDSGDDDLNADQHQTEGQHNLQQMDTLIGHTSCAAESSGNGQHPSLGAPASVSARPAEWEHVSPLAQHNGPGSSRTRIVVSKGGYPRWPPVPRDPLGLCWLQVSASA